MLLTQEYFEDKQIKLTFSKELNLKVGAKVIFTRSRIRLSKWFDGHCKRIR